MSDAITELLVTASKKMSKKDLFKSIKSAITDYETAEEAGEDLTEPKMKVSFFCQIFLLSNIEDSEEKMLEDISNIKTSETI
jgi:hypothetical protein